MNDSSRLQLENALKSLSVNRTDEDAWRVLYEQTRSPAVDAAKRVLRDQDELADDVAQEAYLRIFRYCKFADLQEVDAFLRYLRAVCRNAALDMLKSVGQSPEQGELADSRVSEETPEDLVIARETLNQFMNQLDERTAKCCTCRWRDTTWLRLLIGSACHTQMQACGYIDRESDCETT